MIRAFGPDVNLGNIACDDVLGARDAAAGPARRHLRPHPAAAAGVIAAGGRHARNVVPGAYRGVAVATVDCELDEATSPPLHRPRGLPADPLHRRRATGPRRRSSPCDKESDDRCSRRSRRFELLAGPAGLRLRRATPRSTPPSPPRWPGPPCSTRPARAVVVVQGRYGHVSFIIDPAPLRVTVREVVPPSPAKLLDQTRRVLDVAEHLPPIELVAGRRRARRARRGSTVDRLPAAVPRRRASSVDGADDAYLDERPGTRDWTLIGCERSQQIHEWFYGERAPQVDICPRKRTGGDRRDPDQVLPARDSTSRSMTAGWSCRGARRSARSPRR